MFQHSHCHFKMSWWTAPWATVLSLFKLSLPVSGGCWREAAVGCRETSYGWKGQLRLLSDTPRYLIQLLLSSNTPLIWIGLSWKWSGDCHVVCSQKAETCCLLQAQSRVPAELYSFQVPVSSSSLEHILVTLPSSAASSFQFQFRAQSRDPATQATVYGLQFPV